MSKDKPEVGDVWEFKYGFDRVHIIKINLVGEGEKKLVRYIKKVDKAYIVQRESYLENFIQDYTYLGKSKASINDLFEIEEFNNASIENWIYNAKI